MDRHISNCETLFKYNLIAFVKPGVVIMDNTGDYG
jgi:hypothetical protein